MKKNISLIAHVVAVVCAILVFAFMALPFFSSTIVDSTTSLYDALGEEEKFKGGVAMIVLVVIAALVAITTAVLMRRNKKASKINAVSILTGVLFVVAGILMFCTISLYVGQIVPSDTPNRGDVIDGLKEMLELGAGAYICAFLSLIAGVVEIGNGVLTLKK